MSSCPPSPPPSPSLTLPHPPIRNMKCCLLPTHSCSVCCQRCFSGSAIMASHSCVSWHADCLAFSFLGGSVEALTRFVSPSLTCSISLLLSARQHSPPPTGLPEHGLLTDRPLPTPPSILHHFSFLQIFSTASARASITANSSPASCSHVSKRWKRCLAVKKNLQLCFIFHLTGSCSCP